MQPDPTAVERAATLRVMEHPEPPIDGVIRTFREWLHLPDPGALEVLLGTIAANLMDADPIWLMIVGPPGSGKTALLQGISTLPNVHPTGTLTEAALLSGTPGRERARDAKGGLLRIIGSRGVILCKDFTSVLCMHRDTRASLLAALREIFDGSWTRHVGVDGGRTLHWEGRVALIAGVTPVIDNHHAVMSAMGERFLLYRIPQLDRRQQAGRAVHHAGEERTMRAELTAVVKSMFETIHPAGITMPEGAVRDKIIDLADLVSRGRSAVERDGYSREVELVPDSEMPGRLALGLTRLYGGMRAIGVPHPEGWRLTKKVALDCFPAVRRAVLEALLASPLPMETPDVAAAVRYPTVTAKRGLEDLCAHGLVVRDPRAGSRADRWMVTAETRQLHETSALSSDEALAEATGICNSEKSPYIHLTHSGDFSDSQTGGQDFDFLGVS